MQLSNLSKRKLDVLVLTDVQLGSIWTPAKMLNLYLNEIEPRSVVLLGDFFNTRTFNKFVFANAQSAILEKLSHWVKSGIPIFYIVGRTDAVFMNLIRLSLPALKVSSSAHIDNGQSGSHFFFTNYNVLPDFFKDNRTSISKYVTTAEAINNTNISISSDALIIAPSWRKRNKVLELVGNVWEEKYIGKKDYSKEQLKRNEEDLLESKMRRDKIFIAILNDRPTIEPDIKKNSVERNQFFP